MKLRFFKSVIFLAAVALSWPSHAELDPLCDAVGGYSDLVVEVGIEKADQKLQDIAYNLVLKIDSSVTQNSQKHIEISAYYYGYIKGIWTGSAMGVKVEEAKEYAKSAKKRGWSVQEARFQMAGIRATVNCRAALYGALQQEW